MKPLLIEALLLFTIGVTCDDFSEELLEVPGIRQPIAFQSLSTRATDCGTQYGPVCHDDCRTLLFCGGVQEPVFKSICASGNSETPFCVNGACTSTPDASKPECASGSDFKCTSEGIFPDPNDPAVAYDCEGAGKTPELIRCQPGFCFNPSTKLCRKGTSASICYKLDCSKSANTMIPYPPNNAYYAFCGVPILMFKCLDDENFVFDPKTMSCKFNCKREGNFIDRVDCRKFITCERVSGGYRWFEQTCGSNYYFDQVKQSCVRGTCVSEIITTVPPPPAGSGQGQ